MKPNDLLGHILQRLDLVTAEAHVFTADEVAGWPREALDFFVNQGLLSATTPANTLECDGCEERCFMPVAFVPANTPIKARPFIVCNQREDIGRVGINPNRLKRWRVDPSLLARIISVLLGIDQTPNELIRQRLWFLGKASLACGATEVFLARGLTWTDTGETFGNNRDLKESISPLIFTPGKPSNGFLQNASPVSLDRLLCIREGRLALDLESLTGIIEAKANRQAFNANVFQKAGQFWTISYEGQTFRLKDSKGLQYLAFLLAHPGEEFHAQRLLGEVEGKTLGQGEAARMTERQFLDDGLNVSSLGDAGPLLDDQARKEYKQRLDDLAAELEEAREFNDYERAERVE